jgi:hypothetical protein
MTAQMGTALGWFMLGLSVVGVIGAMVLIVKFAYRMPFVFLITVVVIGSIAAYQFG